MKKLFFLLLILFITNSLVMSANYLKNDKITASFDGKGLVSITDKSIGSSIYLENDNTQLSIDNRNFDFVNIVPLKIIMEEQSISYFYSQNGYTIEIKYELQAGWRFISKQIFINSLTLNEFVVNSIQPIATQIKNEIRDHLSLSNNKYGIALRFRGYEKNKNGFGCFLTVQNPFTKYILSQNKVSVVYTPEMKWNKKDGQFSSDKLCLGFTELTGITVRTSMLPEWNYIEDPDRFIREGEQIDRGEIAALAKCMHAFLLVDPKKSVRVHVGWCENDYQIDISTKEGNTAYKRIIDQAVALGCEHVLFTPANDLVAPVSENKDAWSWENVLWFNMGQRIRKGEWKPGDPLPETVRAIVDYARSKKIGLLSYVYPSMPFMQNPEWTAWRTSNNKEVGGYLTVDTGLRSYQDWLVDQLIAFAKETGSTGFSFDHWWIGYSNETDDKNVMVSSHYQQWYGCRRILEQLRERAPGLVIDGRQQYHHFGTWTWLAGTYPHPTMSDEQPGSFNAITDLSTDRVSAARQRSVAYRLMINDFIPIEIMPGFMTHQTQRIDAADVMHRDHFRVRDWDYFGWKFSLLSSISTAPFNHVINYIPARDQNEYNAFSAEDKAFFNYWLDFTDKNIDYLRNIKPILGQPMVGKCDGTSAIIKDRGYIFVFNPNYRELKTSISLDQSIGLIAGKTFILKEIYPAKDEIQQGVLFYGEKIELNMPGIGVRIFKIEPAELGNKPVLINCAGHLLAQGDKISVTDVSGIAGSEKTISVILPRKTKIIEFSVNNKKVDFSQSENRITTIIQFKGDYFPKAFSLVKYDKQFKKDTITTTLVIPERIISQLNRRKVSWPVTYTDDDKIAPWLDPSRLLLYIQIAQPYRKVEEMNGTEKVSRQKPIRKGEYSLTIDGKPVEINEAYNGVYPNVEMTNLGVFADITSLKPGVSHQLTIKLPAGLKPGQFQGIFIDHIEDEITTELN